MTRRSLTPKERRDMLATQNRLCALCVRPIGKWHGRKAIPFIAEHWSPVALGNTEKPDCLLCVPCADRKTNGSPATSYGSDKHAIAKVKRLLGLTKTGPKRIIDSRPFQKTPEGYRHWPKRPLGKTEGRKCSE